MYSCHYLDLVLLTIDIYDETASSHLSDCWDAAIEWVSNMGIL